MYRTHAGLVFASTAESAEASLRCSWTDAGTLSRAVFENTHQLPSFSLSADRFMKSPAARKVDYFDPRKST